MTIFSGMPSNKSKLTAMVSPGPEKKCSSICSHSKPSINVPSKHVFKSKKQLRDEEERDNILKTRINCNLDFWINFIYLSKVSFLREIQDALIGRVIHSDLECLLRMLS